MKRARKGGLWFLLVVAFLAALPFLILPFSTEPSDLGKIDALGPVEIIAEGFKEPTGIVADQSGELFVSDRQAGVVFRITDGKSNPLVTHLRRPAGLAFDSEGRLLIVEEKSGQLLRLVDGRLTILAGGMKKPRWVTAAEDGTIYVTAKGLRSNRDKKDDDDDDEDDDDDDEEGEESRDAILRFASGVLSTFTDGFKGVQGLVSHGNTVFAVANGLRRTHDHDHEHEVGGVFEIPIRDDGSAGPITRLTHERIKKPVGMARDRLGAFYVSAEELELKRKAKDAIGKIAPDGAVTRFASKLKKPRGSAFDSSGNLYVADDRGDKKGRVIRFRAPPPPTLLFPSFTNQNSVTLRGKSEATSRIDAFLNDNTSPTTLTTPDGSFDLSLDLRLNAENSLDVSATAHNGLGLTSAAVELTIVHDNIAPELSNLQPLTGSFLNTTTPPIGGNFIETGSGVETTRFKIQLDDADVIPQVLSPGGFTFTPSALSEAPHKVTVALFDRAGNSTSASTSFTVDATPPDTQIISGPLREIGETTATFTFTGTDNLTPAGSLQFSWRPDGGAWSGFSSSTSASFSGLSEGAHRFEVKALDLAGNEDATPAARSFTVGSGPLITAIDPSSGAAGDLVSIKGSGFRPGDTQVAFSGVRAALRSATTNLLTVTVPPGAISGPVTVTTSQGSGTSPQPFTVLTRQNFALEVSPSSGQVVQGASTGYAVRAVSTGAEPFSGLVQLGLGLLPHDVAGTFTPSTLGPGATSILTLSTTSFTPEGANTVGVQGRAQIEGRVVMREQTLTLNVQAPGQTVLIGQVRDENERPLAGVSIKQGGATISPLGSTDAGGNFFIPLSVTGPQVFLIDGSSANTATVNYPTIPVTIDIQPGVVNTLGFTPRLHGQPVAKLMPITPGQDSVLTHPDLPGFTMTIPSGVQIIGWDGKPNTQFSVTSVPIDRSPLPPLPSGLSARQIYLFSFGKVGGGTPKGNIPIDTPNDVGGLPGETIDLYYFNEAPDGSAPNQWEKYGTGTVSSDGTRIITDINPKTNLPYGIPRFCCGALARIRRASPAAGGGPSGGQSGSGATDGEPVDTATGFFYLDKTDMVLPGILPIIITRTYRTQLTNDGPFGLGTSWPYDIFLQPPPNNSPNALILYTPGNRQDLFSRQPDGSFVNTTSPPLGGAVATVAGGFRSLRFKDGALWRFDSAGRLVSQADRNGNTLTLIRDGQARVIGISEPSGRQLAVSYASPALRIDTIRDPIGREVRYAYDGSGRLTSVTDPSGGITRYTYDTTNRMLSITDPRGITFLTNEYDGAGRVIKQTQADGGVWSFAYTATGNLISQTTVANPRGHTKTYRFNSAGFLISQTDALEQTTTMERQAGTNLVVANFDSLGRSPSFTYDANGNVTGITDPAGNVRTFEYEPTFNKLTKITDPLGNVTRFEYDAKGNLMATVDPTGARTTITYNAFGHPVSTTDSLRNTTTFLYDDFGNLATIADPLGNRTQRTYDLVSRLIEQTDPRGRSTRFTYDALNRITQIVDGLNGVTSFTYDGNGNLLTVTDARGNTTRHTYDVMDRLTTRTDPLGAAESFEYDPIGNLGRHTDRKGQVNVFSYDALNRRVGGSYADRVTTSFVYDAAGRLTEATDSVGGAILNQYDALDRLVAQITGLGTVSYQYDALGRRTEMDVIGQAPVTYAYDAASRLRQVVQGAQVVDLNYDALGRRTRLTLPNGVSTEYQYDAASRLTALIYRNALGLLGDLTYQYDAAGSRVAVGGSFARTLLPDPVPSATYDAANRQLQFGDKTMTFDANGNLASQTELAGTTIYTWDARNRLVGISGPSLTAGFSYHALGQRVSKTINGLRTDYQHDGNDIVTEFVGGAMAATYLRSQNIDEPFIRQSSSAEFYHADALGSTAALSTVAGVVATTYSYEPFGKTVATGPSSNPLQYTARENDGTGLYYYRARYYSPNLRRFLSEDPIGYVGSRFNLYLYAQSNPVRFVDPTGLKTWIYVQASAGGGIGPLAGEFGRYHLVDPYSGAVHTWDYLGGGVGLSFPPWAAAGQLQVGVYDGPDDPTQIGNWSLEISGFAAAGSKGASFSLGGTSFWGNGENWGSGGYAGGIGASVSGIVTRSWYRGKDHVLPDSARDLVRDLARQLAGKK